MTNLTTGTPTRTVSSAPRAPHQWMVHGNLMVSFTLPGVMADDEWDRFVDGFRNNPIKLYCGAAVGTVGISSIQRGHIIDVLTAKGITTAAITDDTVIRGIATAVSWFGARIKAFSWLDLRKGLDYLGVPAATAERVQADLLRLKAAGRVD